MDLDEESNKKVIAIPSIPSSCPVSHWQVWKVATRLETRGISSPLSESFQSTTLQLVKILRQWGNVWAGHPAWKSVLNKKSLYHEAEESIVALHHLNEWLQSQAKGKNSITVVDLCCGKGLFSMFLSYMIMHFWKDCRVSKIILLDKSVMIDWRHIDAANKIAPLENRPHLELWKGVNLHKYDTVLDRLLQLDATLALVGIHLCKTLSTSAISLVHGLGEQTCPFLCLVPCCVPRVVTSRMMPDDRRRIGIHQYESPSDRHLRRSAISLRDRARRRGGEDIDVERLCYVCDVNGHRARDCPTLAKLDKDEDRYTMLKEAAKKTPCWRCGHVGHFKADCPGTNVMASYIEPPMQYWDIESILNSSHPFEQYCQVLAESLPPSLTVSSHDTGLTNAKMLAHNNDLNWNQGRKGIYIVAQFKG